MELQGRTIVVTGASAGLGRAVSQRLVEAGARVVLVSRNREALSTLSAALPGTSVIVADLAQFEQARGMVREAIWRGGFDALVNAAGRTYEASVETCTVEAMDYLFRLHVLGPVVAMQEAIPHLRSRGGGSLVNLSSTVALEPTPGQGAISASKRALDGFTLAAREELAADRIQVSLVYPGSDLDQGAAAVIRALQEGDAEYRMP